MTDPRVSAILEELPAMIEAAGGALTLMNGNCGVLCCAMLRRLEERGMRQGVEVIIGISQSEYENREQEDFETFGFSDIWSSELKSYEDIYNIGTVHMALMVEGVVVDAYGLSNLEGFHEAVVPHAVESVDFLCIMSREGEDFDEAMENLLSFVNATTAKSLTPEDLLGIAAACPEP